MVKWRLWVLPGIFVILLITVLALWANRTAVESDLSARLEKLLAEHPWVTFRVEGRDVIFGGTAPNENDLNSAINIVSSLHGVRTVSAQAELLPVQSPYEFGIRREDNAIFLQGFVPNEEMAASLIEKFKAMEGVGESNSSLEYARGAPENFELVANFMIDLIANISVGSITLVDRNMIVSGTPKSVEAHQVILAAAAKPVATGVEVSTEELLPATLTPYTFSVMKSDGQVTLMGHVPSVAARKRAGQLVRETGAEIKLDNQLKLASGEPDEFQRLVKFATDQLAHLDTAELHLMDQRISIKGEAGSIADHIAIREASQKSLPEGTVLDQFSVKPPRMSPYRFQAKKSAGQIELEGYVPNQQVRETLRQAALKASDGGQLIDRLNLARGEENGFTSLSSFGFSQLSQLQSGSFRILDDRYSITGHAESMETYQRILTAARGTLPGNAILDEAKITGPTQKPYVWGIDKTGTSIVTFGYVPSAGIKNDVLKRAANAAPELELKNELELAFGSGEEFSELLAFAFSLTDHLKLGKIELIDNSISISGTAKSDKDYRAMLLLLQKSLPASGSISFQNVRLPKQSPYKLSLSKNDNSLFVEGFVPSDNAGESLLQLLRSDHDDPTLQSELRLAAGQPDNFEEITRFASQLMRHLQPVLVELSDESLLVTGDAIDIGAYDLVQNLLQNQIPSGALLLKARIGLPQISPYIFEAVKTTDTVRLTGFAPGENALSAILKGVADSNPDVKITNDVKLASGAVEGFVTLAGHGLSQLKFLTEGRLSISDLDVEIEGQAATPAGYLKIIEIFDRPFPANGKLTKSDVTPPVITPYVLEFVKSDDSVTIGGYVPSEGVSNRLQKFAAETIQTGSIVNNTQIALGQPEEFQQIAEFMVGQLGLLQAGNVRLNNGQISMEGKAKSAAAYKKIAASVKGAVPGSVTVNNVAILPNDVDIYEWSLELSDNRIVLDGHIPDAAARRVMLASIEETMPAIPVVDNMSVAGGAPDGFLDLARFSVGMIQSMKNGKISLSGSELSVQGEASTPEALERAIAFASGLPTGFKIVEQELAPPKVSPFVWTADFSGSELFLSGYIENDASRQAVLTAARTIFSDVEIVDDMALAGGAPDTFGAAANFALGLLTGMTSGKASLSDSTLAISGTVEEFAEYERISENILRNVPSGIQIVESEIPPPLADQYFISFNKSGNKLEIDGYAPTRTGREVLNQNLQKLEPTLEVTNNLKVARGAPDGVEWEQAVNRVGGLITGFSSGSIRMEADNLTVEGNAATDETYKRLNDEFAKIEALNLNVVRLDISKPVIDPYEWRLVKQGSQFTVSGFAQSQEKADQYAEAIKTRLNSQNLKVDLKVGPGTPDEFDAAIELGIGMFERLENGVLTLSNKSFHITGEALTGIAANSVRLKVTEELPLGYDGSHDIKVRKIKQEDLVKSDRCQSLMTEALKEQQILFEANKSVIKAQSFHLLDRLVFVAQQCPKTRVEIAGHTDADGTDTYNQKLSESRAKSVMKYLTRSGVFASRLTAVGYGEDQPIADNDTDEGKAKNRRIEFKIISSTEG